MHVWFARKKNICKEKKMDSQKKAAQKIYIVKCKIVDIPKLCIRITHKYKKRNCKKKERGIWILLNELNSNDKYIKKWMKVYIKRSLNKKVV
jgi:hypothetical protein